MPASATAEVVAMLRELGAANSAHTGRTLLDHLCATADVLEAWAAPGHWCTAALVHSVYSTDRFASALLAASDRRRLRDLIGEPSETLVWLFSILDRDAFARGLFIDRGGHAVTIEPDELAALVNLHFANSFEQLGAMRARPGRDRWQTIHRHLLLPFAATDHAALIDGELPRDVLERRLQAANAR